MYSQTWNKYLPVIRILLKRAATAPQQTGLNKTDFETGGSRTRKLSCSFAIQLEKGRLSTLTTSVAAKDLVAVLQQDDVVASLMQSHIYEISLSAGFQLNISTMTYAEEALPEPVVANEQAVDTPAEGTEQQATLVAVEAHSDLVTEDAFPVA